MAWDEEPTNFEKLQALSTIGVLISLTLIALFIISGIIYGAYRIVSSIIGLFL